MKEKLLLGLMVMAVAGCATSAGGPKASTLKVDSVPQGAHILVSDEEDGPWQAYREKEGLHITPSSSTLKKNEFFWLKLTKAGYADSERRFVRATPGRDVNLTFTLEPASDTATLYIDSEPSGAKVLVSESKDGDYRPWVEAEGEAITPARGSVPVGDSFWIKLRSDKFKDTIPEYVHIASDLPIHLSFDLAKRKRKVEGAAKEQLSIFSDPSDATILVSAEKFGHYEPWPAEAQLHFTPLEVMVDVGEAFWMKLRKDGYETTEPRLIHVEKEEPIAIRLTMKPVRESVQPDRTEAGEDLDDATGIVANGYAIIQNGPGQARNAAILDALGSAIQEKYGAAITARSIAQNYLLMENRVESLAKGEFSSYDVLDEGQDDALYHVKLRVRFRDGLLKSIQAENVTFLVGGTESVEASSGGAYSLGAAADVLMEAGLRVSVDDGNVDSAKKLAKVAQQTQSDMAVYLVAMAREYDRFGEFYSYKTGIDYQLVVPVTGDIVAVGRVEGVNAKRQLTADEAAIHSLRDVGATTAEEVLKKLVQRYDRAASHSVFVTGLKNQRDIATLVKELGAIPGVRDARLLASEEDICEIGLIVSPSTRPTLANAIQRMRNVDLDVDEADLYTTVAHVR